MINFSWPMRRIYDTQQIFLHAASRTSSFNFWMRQTSTGRLKQMQKYELFNYIARKFSTDEKILTFPEAVHHDKSEMGMSSPSSDCRGEIHDAKPKAEENYELMFKEIANGDSEVERRLKILAFEISIFRERFTNVPTVLKKKHWIEMLKLNSWRSKKQYLNYLFRTEKSIENSYEKEKNKTYHRQLIWAKETENHHMTYGLNQNSMFLRIYPQSLVKLLSHRLMAASLYSQHLIFDCSYVDYMSDLNIKFCAKQILFAYSANRMHIAPFHLRFYNFDKNNHLSKQLAELFNCTSENLPIDVDNRSLLDDYPQEKLVYLTPHCHEVLKTFSFDDIYIIGAYVDRGSGKKLSLAKAKDLKIRMAKFPIDRYLDWQKGGKSLPLNIVLDILLDLRYYGNWNQAFKNIPARSLHRSE